MRQYNIGGMSCSACSSRVEKTVSSLEGVEVCSVNLLTNSMTVEGNTPDSEIISAVEKIGYTIAPKTEKKAEKETQAEKKDKALALRLVSSAALTVILMYFSMGHTMWNFPLPSFFANPMSIGIVQLVVSGLVMVINQKFFINGIKGAIHKAPNMDTLVAMGSAAAFIYSLYVLFSMANSSKDVAMMQLHELYFESAAMILTLITVGKALEEHSKGKTTNAISALIKLAPKTVILYENGIEREIPIDELKKGDMFVVKPGGRIGADGIVRSGSGAVDESAISGESIPVDKEAGSRVSAATINLYGHLICEATHVGEDTTLSKIIEMVSDAAATKAPIAKTANKVSAIFVPAVIIIAAIVTAVWLILGESVGFALARGISVLVISCPCALGLATPVAIMVASGVGARNGILFKTAAALEETGRVRTVVLDKTGTITKGVPQVTDVFSENESELLRVAYALERKSEHPLGCAVVKYAEENGVEPYDAKSFKIHSGNGLEGELDGIPVFGGNQSFAESRALVDDLFIRHAEELAGMGKTPMFFGKGGELLGIIAVTDTVKEDTAAAVSELKKMGIETVMLTGDNRRSANTIGKLAGIERVVAEVLPDGKAAEINRLKKDGKVIMVGDGINDAPALTAADIGMAIGTGTDIAIDAADVVLVKDGVSELVAAIRLSRKTLKNIRENLFWAFCYNIIGIPLAAGVFIHPWGWEMNPMFGAAAMSISSFLVVSNALRLNFCRLYSNKKDNEREIKSMEKIIGIEGMMCPHCEARVKEKLEEIDGVVEVIPSHEKKNAVIRLSKEIPDSELIRVIEEQGYKVM